MPDKLPSVEQIIAVGVIMGSLARLYLLRVDFRQYPSYPQGYTIHLIMGAVAAGLGAVAIPAIFKKEYAAVTFLALAVQQFRDVRRMERDSLSKSEDSELVKRGSAYIEDIAKKFEARNYVSMLSAIFTTLSIYIFKHIIAGVIVGWIVIIALKFFIKTKTIQDIADVQIAKVHFNNSLLMIDDIVVMNVGMIPSRKKIEDLGSAVMIIPNDDNARETLANIGQRQAILHDAADILGIRRETDEPEFTPLAKRDSDTGKVGVVIIAMEPAPEALVKVVKRVPVLETSKRNPLDTIVGRKAAN